MTVARIKLEYHNKLLKMCTIYQTLKPYHNQLSNSIEFDNDFPRVEIKAEDIRDKQSNF